jgi:transcription elongation factor Elf1
MPLCPDCRETGQVTTVANAEKETVVCDNCGKTFKQ